MLMRRLLVTTVICSGLVFATGAAQASQTQNFKPNSAWAVSKIDGRSGSGEYCALARRFNGDLILTFARNSRNETSLAIDFQHDVLHTDEKYNVTLKPGYGQDRMFEIQPVSGKAMVVRLGKDDAFYDAMARNAGLKIDISGQAYDFSITDLSQGQAELDGCLAALVTPAAGGNDAPPPPVATMPQDDIAAPPAGGAEKLLAAPVVAEPVPPPVAQAAPAVPPVMAPTVPAVSSANAALATEVESLREENMRLKNAMERERRDFENRFMSQSADSSKATELNEKVRLLEIENNNLKNQLSVTQVPASPVTPDLTDKIKSLEAENESLRQSLTAAATAQPAPLSAKPSEQCSGPDLAANAQSTEALKTELAALRDENARLKTQMADQTARIAALETRATTAEANAAQAAQLADKGAVVNDMQVRIAALEEENAILRTKVKTQVVDAPPGDGVITLAQLRTAEEQLKVVQADRDRLAKQIADMQDNKISSLLGTAAGDWNLEEATKRYNEAEREIRRLGGELEQERTKCIAEKKNIEYMLFDPKISTKEQTARLMQLEEKAMQSDKMAQVQAEGYKSRISSLEKAVSSKDEQMSEVQQRLAAVQQQLTVKDTAIGDAQKKIAGLEQKIAAGANGTADTQIQMAKLQKQLDEKDAQILAMQQSLTAIQQKFASLQQDSASKDGQLKVVQDKLAQAQAQVTQQVAFTDRQQREIEKAKQQLAALSAQRNDIAKAQAQIAQSAQAEGSNADKLALAAAQEEIARLQSERGDLEKARAQIAQLQSEMATLKLAAAKSQEARSGMSAANTIGANTIGAGADMAGQAMSQLAPAAGEVAAHEAQHMAMAASYGATAVPVDAEPLAPRKGAAVQTMPVGNPQASSVTPSAGDSVKTAAVSPAAFAAAVDGRNLMSAGDMTHILQQAGVNMQGNVETVMSGHDMVAYSWDTGTLYGSAEQQPMGNMSQFDGLVKAYLDKTAARCTGEFGAIPGATEDRNGARVATYEIACVTDQGGATAAMVFLGQDGTFTAVAHETGMDSMDMAMDVRDAVYATMMGTTLASR